MKEGCQNSTKGNQLMITGHVGTVDMESMKFTSIGARIVDTEYYGTVRDV